MNREWIRPFVRRTFVLLLTLALITVMGAETVLAQKKASKISRDVAYGGLPKDISHICKEIKILKNTGFVVGYCEELKNPVWVVYQLGKKSTKGGKRPSRFSVDKRTEAKVKHKDYTGSGYDRGHMAPNHAIETRFGREAQLATFLLSNICPQKPDLNRKVWRLLEQKIAEEYAEKLGQIWIVTGPIFGKRIKRLESGVAIPEAFYKVIIDEEGKTVRNRAYIVPQDVTGKEPADTFLTTVDEVEKRTGLDLMWELSDDVEAQVEGTQAKKAW